METPAVDTNYSSTEPFDESTIPAEVRNKVKELTEEVRASREHFADDFQRMNDDAKYHYGLQWVGQHSLRQEHRYIANIIQQFVRKKVDALYAKNPTFTARRRPRMDFILWDEDMTSLMQVEQRVAMGQILPADMQLLMDVQRGLQERKMLDGAGRTLELLQQYFMQEQTPGFKEEMKKYVRRAVVMGVSYIKLGFQRKTATVEIHDPKLADARERMEHLECLMRDAQDMNLSSERAELEELRSMLATQSAKAPAMREGLVYDFPSTTSIIPDMETTSIMGWKGSRFVAEQFVWRRSRIKEKFKINIGTSYLPYLKPSGTGGLTEDSRFWNYLKLQGTTGKEDPLVCWWYVYDKRTGLVYTIADGFPGYLAEPQKPDIQNEQFFPYYPYMTNDCESEEKIFPPSDVRLLRSMQDETNRKREAVRQHRIANRPLYVMAAESSERDDVDAITSDYADHSIIKLKGLDKGQSVNELFQQLVKAPVEPNLYETETDFVDMQRVGGAPAPAIGEVQGATATENSIAENARNGSNSSNVDDFESVLTHIARDASITMLREFSFETVREIVGPGAIWPTFSGEELTRELSLIVEAGSTGRPNSAQKLAGIERVSTLLVQLPGISMPRLVRYVLQQMDPDLDLIDFMDANTPSIQALNAQAKPQAAGAIGGPSTGNPETDPSQQGAQGGNNQVAGPQRPGGPQPAFPAPTMAPQAAVA